MEKTTKVREVETQSRDVDLGRLLRRMRLMIIPILLVTFLVGMIAYYINAHVLTPIYVSTTKIYVLARDSDGGDTVTTGELQAGELLTKDYEDIIMSRNVIENVIYKLKLKNQEGQLLDYEQVLKQIEVVTKSGRRILEISVADPYPHQAQRIANAVRDVAADQIQNIMDTKTVKTVDEANYPTEPAYPEVFSNTVKSALVGFLLSCIIVFLVYLFDDDIRTEEDVERYLHISTLGEIPRISSRRDTKQSDKTKVKPDGNLVQLGTPVSDYRIEEAYRTIRTNLQFCGVDKKVIAVTSCTPNEGKTTVALQLAISLAQIGKRTFFIDADMRKSVLIERITLPKGKKRGLSDLLSGQTELKNVILNTELNNLKLIGSGFFPPNPAELLSNANYGQLISVLREMSDYVIIDTPPLGSVIDSAIIAKECDGAIFVMETGNINYQFAQDVIKQLERSDCPILGAVINKVDMSKHSGKYYNRYYRRGSQRYYGKYYGYGKYGAYVPTEKKDKKNR